MAIMNEKQMSLEQMCAMIKKMHFLCKIWAGKSYYI